MDRIIQGFTKQLAVERRIFDQQSGEITPIDEQELKEAAEEIAENTDRAVFAYKNKINEIDYAKRMLSNFIKTKQEQLNQFKDVLHKVVTQIGPLKTPTTSIKAVEKKITSVQIIDFDECAMNHPEAVTHYTDDNIRTTSISKIKLKKIWEECRGDVSGFSLINKTSRYPDIRIRTNAAKKS